MAFGKDPCDCSDGTWSYKGADYEGCSETPDWKDHHWSRQSFLEALCKDVGDYVGNLSGTHFKLLISRFVFGCLPLYEFSCCNLANRAVLDKPKPSRGYWRSNQKNAGAYAKTTTSVTKDS